MAIDTIPAQPLYTVSDTQRAPLGSVHIDQMGRVWHYAKAGTSDLVGGFMCQGPAQNAGTFGRTLGAASAVPDGSAYAKGGRQFSISTTGATANEFTEGLFCYGISTLGVAIPIEKNTLPVGSVATGILAYPFPHLITSGATRSGMVINPYNGVIIAPTDLTKPPVGVPQHSVPAGYYFWLLSRGLGIVARDGTLVEGDSVMCSSGTAGTLVAASFSITSASTPETIVTTVGQQFVVGYVASYASTLTTHSAVLLNLP